MSLNLLRLCKFEIVLGLYSSLTVIATHLEELWGEIFSTQQPILYRMYDWRTVSEPPYPEHNITGSMNLQKRSTKVDKLSAL